MELSGAPILRTRCHSEVDPARERMSLAVPIASTTLATIWLARERPASSSSFFSRSSALARMMLSWLFNL